MKQLTNIGGNSMKVRALKLNSYPGDTFRRLDILTNNNRWIPVIGVYKNNSLKCWENDTNGRRFKTLTEAKKYAAAYYNQHI